MIKRDQRGFTLIEILVTMSVVALIAGAAGMATVQGVNITQHSNDQMTVIRQVQNAGSWISRDAQMAEQLTIDNNPETANFLILNWTEWDADKPKHSVYHSVTYSLEDIAGDIAKIKRTHWSSEGANEQTLVAEYIYYNPGDPDNTTKASYQNPVLTMQIAASLGEARETKEYRIWRRPQL